VAQRAPPQGHAHLPRAGLIARGDDHVVTLAQHPHHPQNQGGGVGGVGVHGDDHVPLRGLPGRRGDSISDRRAEARVGGMLDQRDRHACRAFPDDRGRRVRASVVDDDHGVAVRLLVHRFLDAIEEVAYPPLFVVRGQHHVNDPRAAIRIARNSAGSAAHRETMIHVIPGRPRFRRPAGGWRCRSPGHERARLRFDPPAGSSQRPSS
jgi:hypothetical protein